MKTARLMYGNGSDMFYATGLSFPDPVPWAQTPDGRTHLCLSPLEYAEDKNKATVDVVYPWPQPPKDATPQERSLFIFRFMLEQDDWPETIEVPSDFPARLFQLMLEAGWPVTAVSSPFFAARAVKTVSEIEKMRAAQQANAAGFARVYDILQTATIGKDDILVWQDAVLTSEILRSEIHSAQLQAGCIDFSQGSIIACGQQAACPHERGHGPLYAHQFILIDCFPRHENRYYGDMTRTFVKGRPSLWHEKIYTTVHQACQLGLDTLKAGVDGAEIHKQVCQVMQDAGFETGKTSDDIPYGYFHGTGHGLGLDVHDFPAGTLARQSINLQAGVVTTVEPGLYYPKGTNPDGCGGCRIEDAVVITDKGIDNLTTFSKDNWVID